MYKKDAVNLVNKALNVNMEEAVANITCMDDYPFVKNLFKTFKNRLNSVVLEYSQFQNFEVIATDKILLLIEAFSDFSSMWSIRLSPGTRMILFNVFNAETYKNIALSDDAKLLDNNSP